MGVEPRHVDWRPERVRIAMCGIVGMAGVPADERILRRMADTIVHRGPDGEGYFLDGQVSLGSRRLSIIDLPGSSQPIFNEDKTVVTVFNGEIYNYRPLRALLEKKGHRLKTAGDTETLVHLYEEYGEASVHLLRGMFAYAIWDSRRHRLVLVRDRLGIKPLYYTEQNGRLLFASEIKAILAVPGIRRAIDPEALDAYLTLQYVPAPLTMLQGIRKLPPGHWLVWEDGHATVEQYWDVVFDDEGPPVEEAAAIEELRGLLQESVELHRISDVPVGVLLSGGLDSTTVTGLLHLSGERPSTFTVGFEPGAEYGEIAEARRVAEHFDTVHHELLIGPTLADVIPRLVWYQDEPVADPAAVPLHFICQFAARSVKVLLTGEGGDELFGGYPRYRWLHWSKQLLDRPYIGPVTGRLGGAVRALLPTSRIADRMRLLVSPATLAERQIEWVANMGDPLKSRLLVTSAPSAGGSARSLVSALIDRSGSSAPISALTYCDLKTWLPDNILTKMDRMSMAASVEGRVPLLDHKVVEFATGLPYQLKLNGLRTKQLLREAMRSTVPHTLLKRRKRAFRVPVGLWLQDPLSTLLHDTLSPRAVRERGLFTARAVGDLLAAAPGSHPGRTQTLWNLLWFELWCRQYLDENPAADR